MGALRRTAELARRERTTGLPRPQRRQSAGRRSNPISDFFAGDGGPIRLLLIGGSVLALIVVIFALAANIYHDRWGHARETVVTVGDEKFSLRYYSERLYQQALANPSESLGIAEQALLQKFEEEGITIAMAKERGIDLSDDAVNQEIATSLGVPFGGSGSAYDSALRARLASLKMSHSSFRKMMKAQLADRKMAEIFKGEVATTGEATTLRIVTKGSQEAAKAILSRIQAGEDMAAVAAAESGDASASKEGLLDPQPTALLDAQVKTAIEGKATGELLGPFQVGGQWWVARVETREPAFTYTEDHRTRLGDVALAQAIRETRPALSIKRDIDSGDISWAVENLG